MEDGSLGDSSPESGPSNPEKDLFAFNTSKFEEIVKLESFVDKSLFIKAFFQTKDPVLVTAPSRFGKSTNMDILKQFLLGNSVPFQQLKIMDKKEGFEMVCRHRPVIYIDFGTIGSLSYTHFLHSLRSSLRKSFMEHEYLVEKTGDNTYAWKNERLKNSQTLQVTYFMKYRDGSTQVTDHDLISGLNFLSQVLCKHYNEKVYILIDHYDHPLMRALNNNWITEDEIEDIVRFLQCFTVHTIRFNKCIEHALINACAPVARTLLGDANPVIKHYPFLDQHFAQFFGFTNTEVTELLERPVFKRFKDKRDEIDKWYYGYKTKDEGTKIYSSSSILKYLENSIKNQTSSFDAFWVDTGYIKSTKKLFAKSFIRANIQKLIDGGKITIERSKSVTIDEIKILRRMIGLTLDLPDDKCANLFLQLLADSGCFNMWPALKTKEEVETEDIEKIDEESAGMAKTDVTHSILVVPNSEIKRYLTAQCDVADSVQSEYQVQADRVKRYIGALMSVLQQQNKSAFDTLATAVAEMFSDQASMPENEYDLHSILFTFAYVYIDLNTCCKIGIVKGRKKNVRGELASNIIVTRLDTGLILEIKYDHSSSKEALCQIFDKKYDTIFNDHRAFKNKIYVGLHMSKSDEVTISYIVDSTEGKLKGTASSVDKDNKCA